VVGTYAAFYADRAVGTYPESQAAVVQPANESCEPTSSGRSLILESDRQGHFQVEVRVEGRFVDFIVDTGASLVVLREATAAEVGIRPQPRDYTATANGKIMAARATIERIEVGGITVYDVPATWCCPTRRWRKTCSASHSCHGSSATNTPTGAWCLNSRQRLPVSPRIDLDGALCASPALGYWISATLCLRT
jgi:aspartyl protease family protein